MEALKKFVEYYKNNDRGILSLPCGTGKTYTSYLISKNYNQIVILSPLKEFAKQNLTKYVEYGYEYNTLLVDSDGTRYLNEEEWLNMLNDVKKYIDENNKRPSACDKNNDIKKIGCWINNQQANYDLDITKCKEGMKNEEIKKEWENFYK